MGEDVRKLVGRVPSMTRREWLATDNVGLSRRLTTHLSDPQGWASASVYDVLTPFGQTVWNGVMVGRQYEKMPMDMPSIPSTNPLSPPPEEAFPVGSTRHHTGPHLTPIGAMLVLEEIMLGPISENLTFTEGGEPTKWNVVPRDRQASPWRWVEVMRIRALLAHATDTDVKFEGTIYRRVPPGRHSREASPKLWVSDMLGFESAKTEPFETFHEALKALEALAHTGLPGGT